MILSSLKSAIPWSDKKNNIELFQNAVLLHFLHHVAQQPVHFPDRLIHLFRLTPIGVPAAIHKTEIERAEIGIYLPGRIHPDRHTVDPGPIGNRPAIIEPTYRVYCVNVRLPPVTEKTSRYPALFLCGDPDRFAPPPSTITRGILRAVTKTGIQLVIVETVGKNSVILHIKACRDCPVIGEGFRRKHRNQILRPYTAFNKSIEIGSVVAIKILIHQSVNRYQQHLFTAVRLMRRGVVWPLVAAGCYKESQEEQHLQRPGDESGVKMFYSH